jgi:cytochrome c5
LIIVVLLAFLVPIIGIILLVQLITSRPSAEPNTMRPEAVAERIQPVGRIEFAGEAKGPGGPARSGEQIVKSVCAACHQTGVANAPKLGDKAAWAKPLQQGQKTLVANAIKGIRNMPPRGGDGSLSDLEVERAVVYMANLAGAGFKEPAAKEPAKEAAAAPKEAAKPEAAKAEAPKPQVATAAEKPAAAAGNGKKIYDQTCMVCHAAGVANAPKLGDKAAWAPRIQQGLDALVQASIKGKGAMPPKGGNASLSDADLRAAVEFMVSQSK